MQATFIGMHLLAYVHMQITARNTDFHNQIQKNKQKTNKQKIHKIKSKNKTEQAKFNTTFVNASLVQQWDLHSRKATSLNHCKTSKYTGLYVMRWGLLPRRTTAPSLM